MKIFVIKAVLVMHAYERNFRRLAYCTHWFESRIHLKWHLCAPENWGCSTIFLFFFEENCIETIFSKKLNNLWHRFVRVPYSSVLFFCSKLGCDELCLFVNCSIVYVFSRYFGSVNVLLFFFYEFVIIDCFVNTTAILQKTKQR